MVKRKKNLSDSKRKLLIIAVAAIVIGGFYRAVVEPFALKAKIARPVGKVNPTVATSSLASQTELPFLKSQGNETLEGGEVYDGVFYVDTKEEEPKKPVIQEVTEVEPDYTEMALAHYQVQMISRGGAIVNDVYYSYGETIADRPYSLIERNVSVKLMSKVNQSTIRLMVNNKFVNVAVL